MPAGARVELAIHGPSNCPLVGVSEEAGTLTDVTWTRENGAITEEFRADGLAAEAAPAGAEPVFGVGDEQVYQYTVEADRECACEVVESLGCPIADARVEDGAIVLTLHVGSVDRLREVMAELDAVADRIELRYLARAGDDGEGESRPTLVDLGQLTERQREVVRTAYELGYFEYPGGANASEVAEELDIGLSTFAEHIAAAQRKLLDDLLEAA